jgi:2-dehydro-3-deoxygalactonokinase
MRGEETQAIGWAGVSGRIPGRAVVVLPGTHSKHLTVDRGRVTSFATYMTGEFFDLLSKHGVLSKTVAQRSGKSTVSGRARFAEGVRVGAQENLLHASFLVRTRSVLARVSANDARQFLSGLLLGAELAALASSRARQVDIVADQPLDRLYERALRILGFRGPIRRHSASETVIAGQSQIARQHRLLAS